MNCDYTPGPHDRITRDDTPHSPEWAIDEVVLTGVAVHYEQLDDHAAMLILTGPGGLRVHVDLYAAREVRSNGSKGVVLRAFMLDAEGIESLGDRVTAVER